MGSFTDQKYYKVDTSEFVNVGQDLAYNWRLADETVKPLLEYQVTNAESVSQSSLPRVTGMKYLKTYSNSIYYWNDFDIYQDPNAYTDNWDTSGITFETNYGSANSTVARIAWQQFGQQVRLRGRLVLNAGASDFPVNVSTKFLTLPTALYPTKAKYFTVYGGNATADFMCFRIFIPNSAAGDKRIEFCKYGGNGTTAADRYISLNDVKWHIDA